jgi:HlyD family secretion protein
MTIVSSPSQARKTRQQFANSEDYLSYELGKAVQELPPLYMRLLAGSISLLVLGAIAWAYFSKIDEVAVAPGELMASIQVRPVRSLGSGTIREVKVKEGDRITKGDILIERDRDLPQVEVDRLAKSTQLIREDLERLEAERTGTKNTGTNLQDQLLNSRLQDFQSRRLAALAEANRQIGLINEARIDLSRLQENLSNAQTNLTNAQTNFTNAQTILAQAKTTLANAQKREQALRILLSDGATPRLDYIEAQDRIIQAEANITKSQDSITNAQNKITEAQDKVISLEKAIAAQQQKIQQAEQAYQAAHQQAEGLASQRQSEILTEIKKRREEQTTVEGQLAQAKKQREQETIPAPISGTVYSIKGTKGPVQSGEELLSILPAGEELLLEVKILNRDIGFIRQDMKAKIKIATFPFQEFGTIDGTIIKISPNAITDKDLGLVFPSQIKLAQHSIKVRGQDVALTPGMTATAEIITRKKSVLTFLIEPVTRRFSEAFSVR